MARTGTEIKTNNTKNKVVDRVMRADRFGCYLYTRVAILYPNAYYQIICIYMCVRHHSLIGGFSFSSAATTKLLSFA